MLLDQRVIFLGGEVKIVLRERRETKIVESKKKQKRRPAIPLSHALPLSLFFRFATPKTQVNDFVADAIISQLLLLDAKDAKKVKRENRWTSERHFGDESKRERRERFKLL